MSKRLYRSKKDRMIFGVCGGISEYFNVDSTIVRILTVLLAYTVSGVVVLYLLMGLVIPENPEQEEEGGVDKRRNNYLIGAGLVVIGLISLLKTYNLLTWSRFWPAVMIMIGVFIVWEERRKD